MSSTTVDLSGLAMERGGEAPRRGRRTFWVRYALPAAILLGFAGVVGWAARDRWLPAQDVRVVPVVARRTTGQRAGTPLFQAAGWVEPRPTPVAVTALTEGVVESLFVVAGQEVRAGDAVARLIDVDARLAVRQAQAHIEIEQAELTSKEAELKAAQTRLAYPVHLEAALAEAQALVAEADTQVSDLPFQIATAASRLAQAEKSLSGKSGAAGAVSERMIEQAQTEERSARAELEQLRAREPRLKRQAEALAAKAAALARQLELKTEELRAVAEAEAAVRAAQARLHESQAALEVAQLRLDRTNITAPIQGRVLELVATPGSRVMGLAPGALSDASTLVKLYDPRSLQVRADVLLEDVPRVLPGQKVRIDTPAAPGPLQGTVLQVTSSADIQKNTLQVKVAIDDPPATVRPEMLVRATFLAAELPAGARAAPSLRLFVPRSLVAEGTGGAQVWLLDRAAGVCRQRSIQLGADADDGLVEVVAGLNLADKLIASPREGLAEGARVRLAGEDPALGAGERAASSAGRALPRLTPAGTPQAEQRP
jgi:RND family efflux transporter MFP subunit